MVAAFIDGARERQRTVTTDVIKQVGATAKRLINNDGIPIGQLKEAAREMGRRGWKDLNIQLLRGFDPASGNGYQPYNNNPDPDHHAKAWAAARQKRQEAR